MAVIKTIRNPLSYAALFEDPIPGSNYIYFQLDAYTKDTIAPLHDLGFIYTTSGQVGGNYGYSAPQSFMMGGHLMLADETTYVRHSSFNTQATYLNNLDMAPFLSMDTNYKITPMKYFTDGTNNLVIGNYNINYPNANNGAQYNYSYPETWTKLNTTSKDLYSSGYVTTRLTHNAQASIAQFGNVFATYDGCTSFPIYRNPATNNLVWLTQLVYTANGINNAAYTPGAMAGGTSWVGAFSASPTRQGIPVTGVASNATGQLVGVSKLDGFTIQLLNGVTNDYGHTYYKYNDGSNTTVVLNTINTAPTTGGSGGIGAYNISTATYINTTTLSFVFTATNNISTFTGTATVYGTVLFVTAVTTGTLSVGMTITNIVSTSGSTLSFLASNTVTTIVSAGQGTNQGGNRGTGFGQQIPKFASKTFPDEFSTGTSVGFYVPYVDATGFFHPLYTQWNQTTDNFTRFTDITMIYPGGNSQSTYWTPDNVSGTSITVNHGMQRCWYTETYVSSSTRYLIFMQLHGAGGVYDSTPLARTFPVYAISTSSYKVLTYNSKIEVPATPKNIVWLSDDRTILGVFCHSNFYVYTFSSNSGWTLTGNFPFQFNSVGRDNLGRIWAHDTGLGYGRLHLLTLNVPVSIVVTSDATSYNFAGTAVSANLTVNAFSYSGARIATSVKLVIDGGSMTFAGSNLTKTVTTSATGDTLVPITITGGGVSNIIASAVVS